MANEKNEEERDVLDMLTELDDGQLVGMLNQHVREVVRAAESSGNVGTVTLKLTVKRLESGQMSIDPTVTTKVPRRKPGSARFFSDEAGQLYRSNPRQVKLKGIGNVQPIKKAGDN